MNWHVGDTIRLLRRSESQGSLVQPTTFERVVMEVSPQYLTLRHKTRNPLRFPTERVKRVEIEEWWRGWLVEIEPWVYAKEGA